MQKMVVFRYCKNRNIEYTSRFWMWMLYDNPEFDFINQVEINNTQVHEKIGIIVDTINGLF